MTSTSKGIKPQSRKAKGRKLQQFVRDQILKAFQSLTKDDVWSRSMGAGGTDVQLSAEAKRCFPYSIECKSGKLGGTVPKKVYDWIDQAEGHGDEESLVVFKADYKQPYVIVSLEHFMELIQRGHSS